MKDGGYILMNHPSGISIFYDRIEIDKYEKSYELFWKKEFVAILDLKTNRIENFPDIHATLKKGSEDNLPKGQALGFWEAMDKLS